MFSLQQFLPHTSSKLLDQSLSLKRHGHRRFHRHCPTTLSSSHQSGPSLCDSKTQVSRVPLLTSTQAYEKLKTFRENIKGKQQFLAMYSSIFGGITTDPAAMVIPMDDHMVHRGHGVFDTAAIMDGSVIFTS
ncbi:D-amino-acid transaminase, chloroplastic [Glycine soja]